MEEYCNDMHVGSKAEATGRISQFEEPQGELEHAIAQLWRELFHTDKVGRNDNFFELGGNSLLGMDLSEMLATRMAIEIPALVIFQNPTIAEMTQFIQAQ